MVGCRPVGRLVTRRRFWRNERGSVAIMSAILALVGCLVAALAIDVGSVALNARRLQGAADLAAMAAAADLDNAQNAATLTAEANAPDADVTVGTVLGQYAPDPDIAPADRFVAGGAGANAVRVTLQAETRIYFGALIIGSDTVPIQRTATAALDSHPRAMFSIGSRLAQLNGGVANQVLSGLTGSTVSLSVMDYNALASTQINLLEFSDALATELDLTVGDYDSLLEQEVNAGTALSVIEGLAGDQADSALSELAAAAVDAEFSMDQLIGVEADASDGVRGALDANVSALDLANAILEIGAGDRQLALQLAVPAGIADLDATLAIGERPNNSPWLAVTREGTPIIRTAQARLYIRLTTAQKLSGLAKVNLPILIELASSEARLNAVECDPERTVTLGVRPGVAKASIGTIDESKLDDFTYALTPTQATVLSVAGLVTVKASAHVEAADAGFTAVHFSDAEIENQTVKTVKTTGMVNGVIVSLFQNMTVNVQALGLGLGLGGLASALGALLAPLGPLLDGLINPLLDILGLSFGEADVRVHGARCENGTPSLVG